MPCVIRRIALTGTARIEPVPFEAESLRDSVRFEQPGGVYAAFGTWNDRRVIRLGAHFDRLVDSARRLGYELHLDRDLVRSELCTMMQEAGYAGAKVRLSVTPNRDGALAAATAAIEPYAGPPLELRERGVACRTAPHAARSNPRAKQTSWLAERGRLGDAGGPEAGHGTAGADREAPAEPSAEPYEWLLLDDDERVLEGASSNFYAIIAGADATAGRHEPSPRATLLTAGEGVLPGIARSIVLEVAPDLIDVELRAPTLAEAYRASEAFITSASRGIVPVVAIDGRTVGSGEPGPVTMSLIRRYDERARELEESVCT